jgi:hypothetical protein
VQPTEGARGIATRGGERRLADPIVERRLPKVFQPEDTASGFGEDAGHPDRLAPRATPPGSRQLPQEVPDPAGLPWW